MTGHFAELGCQVDAGHAAAEAVGEVARRPADAAADIEQVDRSADRTARPSRASPPEPAAVELVVGRERIQGGTPGVEAVVTQGGIQPLQQVTAGVVMGDVGRGTHRWVARG
jgi:hypothetical protein